MLQPNIADERERRIAEAVGEVQLDLLRRGKDRSFKTRLLEFLDIALLCGNRWRRPNSIERRHENGSLYEKHAARRSLAGHLIPWGMFTRFYEDGSKAEEGYVYWSLIARRMVRSGFRYWLPDGSAVPLKEYLRHHLCDQIDALDRDALEILERESATGICERVDR
jgi:hypothetical protein